MHSKEKNLIAQEEEKGLAGAVAMDRPEGLGSRAQKEGSSNAREGKAGLMVIAIGRWVGVVAGVMETTFW